MKYIIKRYSLPRKLIYLEHYIYPTIADIADANESIWAAVIVFNTFFEFREKIF